MDTFIIENIPSGTSVRSKPQYPPKFPDTHLRERIEELCNRLNLNTNRVFCSLGTLGGGNHFIEIGEDPEGFYWLTVHSGSRNFGLMTAEHHQDRARAFISDANILHVPKGLEYLPIKFGGQEYLDDMKTAQEFAHVNREYMARDILLHLGLDLSHKVIRSVHNYIDFDDNTLRKGAIKAHAGDLCVIPFNMRDGIAVCKGIGSKKWNQSAPHGAGRTMSRSKAKEHVTLDQYRASMQGIWSSCITNSTIDESPFAYKDMNEIINFMSETVSVEFLVKPKYNFKAK